MCGIIFKEDTREKLKRANFSLDEWEFIFGESLREGYKIKQIK